MTQPDRKRTTSSGPARNAPPKKSVTFEYFDPSATVVSLVGEFNQWNPVARPLKRTASGLWKGTLQLEPGQYQYKFVVNGQRWEEDPLNPHRVPNMQGTFNSVRTVGGS
jgi:1,4-alpha-glucan branching enzyme